MKNALFLTTWPSSPGQGSGTALFIRSLRQAVEAGGTMVELVNPMLDTRNYVQFTLERFWFNVEFARDSRPAQADWILGLDYDGFALPRQPDRPFIASVRGLFADLVDTEPEPFRTMLRAQAYFEQHNVQLAHLITTPSRYAKGRIVEYYDVKAEKVHVIPNGIDLIEWDALWRSLPEPDRNRRPTVLAVSKLYPRKKIDVLVRAVPLLRRDFPEVEVRIVGGGFEWEALQKLSAETGATSSITWLDDIDDRRQVVAEFKRAHVFTHPSIQETFGNVCLESMASARPLVVSDAASLPDLVCESQSGLVVPPNDPAALASTLSALLHDEARREELGRNGRHYAEKMTWQNTAAQFMSLVP